MFVRHFRPAQQIERGERVARRGIAEHARSPFRRNVRGLDARVLEAREFARAAVALGFEERPALVVDEAELAPDGREAQVGIVFAQQQAMFGAAGEHAIRLARAARHQVVDEHADVALAALRDEGLLCRRRARGVDAGDEALRRGFFVARGAVDLAREKQARERLRLERGLEIARIEEVVFDGVARAA